MSGAELLERAVSLCRMNVGQAMVAHLIGTAPFVGAVLYFCLYMTGWSNADDLVLPYSFLLALLWIWLNVWHSVCCETLMRSLEDIPVSDRHAGSLTGTLITSTAIQGPGPLLLLLSAGAALPFPWAHAFLQNCHVYAGRLGMKETISFASRHAGLWPKQNWQLFCCIFVLSLITFVNLMLAMYLGAQLLNSLFGIATVLARTEGAIFDLPYLMTSASITYMVVDPVWKAAHVLRCFEAESMRTGADLRLTLRRTVTLVAMLVFFLPAQAQTPPPSTAQKYDSALNDVFQRPEYEWAMQKYRREAKADSAFQRSIGGVRDWLERNLQSLVDWLQNMAQKDPPTGKPAPPGAGLRWLAIVAIVLCAIAVLVMAAWPRLRRPTVSAIAEPALVAQPVDLADEAVTPDKLPADEWLALADNFLQKGDARLAARAVYLGTLAQFDRDKWITLGRHKTNLEYGRELTRRARSRPAAIGVFQSITQTFERCWYGEHAVNTDEVRMLRASLAELKSHA